jgi:signal transduction histidine kinase
MNISWLVGTKLDESCNKAIVGACLVLLLIVLMCLSREAQYRQQLSEAKGQQQLKVLVEKYQGTAIEKTSVIRLSPAPEGSRDRILVVQSPGLLGISVELGIEGLPWESVTENVSPHQFYMCSTPREFPLNVPYYTEADVRVTTWAYDKGTPNVAVYDSSELVREQIVDHSLELLFLFIPSVLLLIVWMYGGIENTQLKFWISSSIILSILLLCASFEHLIHLKLMAMGSVDVSQALIAIVSLAVLASANIARLVSVSAAARSSLGKVIFGTIAATFSILIYTTIDVVAAISLVISMVGLVNLAILMSLEEEAFFSSWAVGLRIMSGIKVTISAVALICFASPHPLWLDTGLPLMASGSSILGLFYLQFNHRKLKDKLAISYAQRQREINTIRFTEAGVRMRETVRGYRHDLRQPLQSLTLMLGLESHLSQNPSGSVRTHKMIAAQKSLTAMLDDFFNTMDHELEGSNSENTMVSLNSVLSPLVAEYGQIAGNKSLFVRYVSTNISVMANPEPLRRLIRNVIDNAVKYTSEGGILIGVRWKKRHWQLLIQDTGPGISSQAEKSHKGWGYGSVLMKKLAKRTNVRVLAHEMKATNGSVKGTRVIIEIPKPVRQEQTRPNEEIILMGNNVAQAKVQKNVIVLADQKADLSVLLNHLKALDVHIVQVNSLVAALNRIGKDKLPGGLICVGTDAWNNRLEEWELQLGQQSGIPIPTLWVDQRSSKVKANFPLPPDINELDMDHAELSNTAFILADHFGFETGSEQTQTREREQHLPIETRQSNVNMERGGAVA